MKSALWLLVFLGVRARYRRLLRGLRTVRGILLILVGALFFTLVAIGPYLSGGVAPGPDIPHENLPLQRFGPAGLLAFCLLSVFGSTKYRGVYFSPAEVDFLFPAPFTRRELIAYRLLTILFHVVLGVLFLGAFLSRYVGGYWHTVAGLFLVFGFINLLQIAVSLVAGTLEERVVARGRLFAAGVLGIVAVTVFIGSSAAVRDGKLLHDVLREWLGSPAVGWALLPLKTFSETLAAPDIPRFLAWGTGALLVDLALVFVVLRLDVDYTEASLETSRRVHARLDAMRRGGRIITSSRKLRLSLPLPPRWGGAGSLAWRQAQEMVRDMPGAFYLVLALAVGVVLPLFLFGEVHDVRAGHLLQTFTIVTIMLPLLLSNWFRFDFRGDHDRMEILRGLPLGAVALSIGQLLVPTLILSVLQILGFAALGFLGMQDAEGPDGLDGIVRYGPYLSLPFNLLFVALENLFFLLFPRRLIASTPGDLQTLGRLTLITLMKLAVLGIAAMAAFLAAKGAHYLSGGSAGAAVAAAAGVIFVADFAAVALVAWAFIRFDGSQVAAD